MSNEKTGFSQTKLSKALRGAAKAGHRVTHARIFANDEIELEFADPIERMTEAELIAGLEALDPPSESERG
jgi:hypothetical protein